VTGAASPRPRPTLARNPDDAASAAAEEADELAAQAEEAAGLLPREAGHDLAEVQTAPLTVVGHPGPLRVGDRVVDRELVVGLSCEVLADDRDVLVGRLLLRRGRARG
jgi:hypothetical protein